MAEQRQRVVTELINTEKDYCNDLELCVTYFLRELQISQVSFGYTYNVRCRTPQRKLASMASFISAARRAFLRPRDDLRRVGEWGEVYRRSLSALDP